MKNAVISLASSKFAPAVIFASMTLFVFSLMLILGRSFFVFTDNIDQAFAWYQKLSQLVHTGQMPVWDANTFSGHSFVGDFVTGAFYPLNLLAVWLFGDAGGIKLVYLEGLVALHFFIASIGMYLLAREWGLNKPGSYVSGLLYAYSGVVIVRAVAQTCIFFGLAWLPLAIYLFLKKGKYWPILAGLVLALMILAGHIQPYFHAVLILGLYTLWSWVVGGRGLKSLMLGSGKLLAAIASSFVFALPQLILSAQYLQYSYRWMHEGFVGPGVKIAYGTFAKVFIFEPDSFANLINPIRYQVIDANYIFLGIAPLVIILVFMLSPGWYRKLAAYRISPFLAIISVFGLLAVIGYHTFFAAILYKLPFFEQIRQPGRYVIFIHLALVFVSGVAIAYLQKSLALAPKTRIILAAIGGFLVVDSIYLFIGQAKLFGSVYATQILFGGLLLMAVAAYRHKARLYVLMVGSVAVTCVLNALLLLPKQTSATSVENYYRINEVIGYLAQQPRGQYRTLVQEGALPINIGDVYPISTISGYGPTLYKPYADYLRHDPKNLRLDPPLDSSRLDDLGVRYIVSKQPRGDLRLVIKDTKAKIYLYERKAFRPKIYLAGSVASGRVDPGLRIIKYQDTHQVYNYTAPTAGRYIINELSYPGWRLVVDGRVVKDVGTQSKDFVFNAVDLTPGVHRVELSYRPFNIR